MMINRECEAQAALTKYLHLQPAARDREEVRRKVSALWRAARI